MRNFPWFLSFCVGFLSLSQEILWVRVAGYALHSLPFAFSLVLTLFLVGIAAGAWIGKRLCERSDNLLALSGWVLGIAGILDFVVMPLLAILVGWGAAGAGIGCFLIIVTAAFKSILFPIAHHLGANQAGAFLGRKVSKVYFGNILGSTLGPIVTGYFALEYLGVDKCMALVGLATLLLGAACFAAAGRRYVAVSAMVAVTLLGIMDRSSDAPFITKGADRYPETPADPKYVVQNRHGIIHVIPDDQHGDTVFGRNAYDGRTSIDISKARNGLDRALIALAAHPAPKQILVVGMSTGAWTRLLGTSPMVENIDVVEINPGYLELIRHYPDIAPIESDPRIHIYIDDGRRWLKRHTGKQYDLIVQNTTAHWLANTTNLLSQEHFRLLKGHLAPGGILAVNTTESESVSLTVQSVFKHTARFSNFLYASEMPLPESGADAEHRLRALTVDNKPFLAESQFADGGSAQRVLKKWFVTGQEMKFVGPAYPMIVTDQNMNTEYLSGRVYRSFPSALDWLAKWRASKQ